MLGDEIAGVGALLHSPGQHVSPHRAISHVLQAALVESFSGRREVLNEDRSDVGAVAAQAGQRISAGTHFVRVNQWANA